MLFLNNGEMIIYFDIVFIISDIYKAEFDIPKVELNFIKTSHFYWTDIHGQYFGFELNWRLYQIVL